MLLKFSRNMLLKYSCSMPLKISFSMPLKFSWSIPHKISYIIHLEFSCSMQLKFLEIVTQIFLPRMPFLNLFGYSSQKLLRRKHPIWSIENQQKQTKIGSSIGKWNWLFLLTVDTYELKWIFCMSWVNCFLLRQINLYWVGSKSLNQ